MNRWAVQSYSSNWVTAFPTKTITPHLVTLSRQPRVYLAVRATRFGRSLAVQPPCAVTIYTSPSSLKQFTLLAWKNRRMRCLYSLVDFCWIWNQNSFLKLVSHCHRPLFKNALSNEPQHIARGQKPLGIPRPESIQTSQSSARSPKLRSQRTIRLASIES